MKPYQLLFIILSITFSVNAQEKQINLQLNKFSPLAEIIVSNLGLQDINGNGVIDKGQGEGYEEFAGNYGIGETYEEKEKSVDCGFFVNYLLICRGNEKLEENEIVNHYYKNIRFAPDFKNETEIIESQIKSYFYTNNLPLFWLDDEQDTVKKAVDKILGEGWNEQTVTEDEAVSLYQRVMQRMGIAGRKGLPSEKGGYYTLPEFTGKRAGFCVEAAQFAFWFFSELRIRSFSVHTHLTSSISHEVIKMDSGRIVDYFRSSARYNIKPDDWQIANPLQTLSLYYGVKRFNRSMLEQAVLYDKYTIDTIGELMSIYYNNSLYNNIDSIIHLGEFFLANNDIEKVINAKHKRSSLVKAQVKSFLLFMLVVYDHENNRSGNEKMASLLQKYYSKDAVVKDFLKNHRF